MVVFTGHYNYSVDSKGRVSIPAGIRNMVRTATQTPEEVPLIWYVSPGKNGLLWIYTEQGFMKQAAKLEESEMDTEEFERFERMFFGLSERVEMDKAGRIRLPEMLLKQAGLSTEVTLVGVRDHLEVQDRAAWEQTLERDLDPKSGVMMSPRRAMRKTVSTEAD